jgi:two-component system chemotaxis response regulator CheB
MLNDGAAGLADVKRCGGLTIVQNPSDAEAPDMPMGALRGSDVDYRAPLSDIPALLTQLVNEEAGPAVAVATDINDEVQIALGRRTDSDTVIKFADPVALTCPSCGGVLSQVKRGPLRFRCQVGHGYTAETLSAEKEATVDEAIRVALRIMEERTLLTLKMADEARESGMGAAANSYEARANESRSYADALRRSITGA